MSRRRKFIIVISVLAIIIAVATLIAYFLIKPDKPWMAFFVACCGGVLLCNLLLSLILVLKNIKN